MEYNSQKEKLVISEYGRNVQNLINHAKTIEDPKERQAFTEEVIRLMMQMNPQNKNMDDFRERVWNHLFRIAKHDLEVAAPEGIDPKKAVARKQPDQVPYPTGEHRFRHYGHNVQVLIKKALEMEEGPKRDEFVTVIGSYMKLAYRTWNREHYVSDEVILADLEGLSNGQLKIPEGLILENLAPASKKRKRNSSNGRNNKGGNKNYKGQKGNRNKGGKRK